MLLVTPNNGCEQLEFTYVNSKIALVILWLVFEQLAMLLSMFVDVLLDLGGSYTKFSVLSQSDQKCHI